MSSLFRRIFSYSRYLTLGLMDAGLTSLSVLTAAYLSGITEGLEVVKLALAVGIGIAASNLSGAYLAEETEIIKQRIRAEKAMGLRQGKLMHTILEQKLKQKMLERALVNSISGFLGIIISTAPMLFFPFPFSYYYAWLVAIILLGFLGIYIAKVVNRNIFKSAIKVVMIAVLVMVLNFILAELV